MTATDGMAATAAIFLASSILAALLAGCTIYPPDWLYKSAVTFTGLAIVFGLLTVWMEVLA